MSGRPGRIEPDASAFVDRVMASIADLPQPTPTRAFGWSLRAGAWGDARASLWVAWHLATARGWPVAPRVRARSMALVLAVATVLAAGSLVAAAAVQVAVPHRHEPLDRLTTLPVTIGEPALHQPGGEAPERRPGGGPGPVAAEPVDDDHGSADTEGDQDADGDGQTTSGADDGADDGGDGGDGDHEASEDRSRHDGDDADADGDGATDGHDRAEADDDAPDHETDRDGGGDEQDSHDGEDGGE